MSKPELIEQIVKTYQDSLELSDPEIMHEKIDAKLSPTKVEVKELDKLSIEELEEIKSLLVLKQPIIGERADAKFVTDYLIPYLRYGNDNKILIWNLHIKHLESRLVLPEDVLKRCFIAAIMNEFGNLVPAEDSHLIPYLLTKVGATCASEFLWHLVNKDVSVLQEILNEFHPSTKKGIQKCINKTKYATVEL